MKVVILCGGQGTRIREVSEAMPKPMLTIGNKPILWHVMKIYASHGVTDFVLAVGYKGWLIKEYFLNYQAMQSDFTIGLGRRHEIQFHDRMDEADWNVTLVDTGEHTTTGGRVWRVRQYLENEEDCFCLTYGDAVADINIRAVIEQHCASGLAGTLSAVRVGGRFGEIEHADGRVVSFEEKPAVSAGRINGGFMVFDAKRVWDYFGPADLPMEHGGLLRMVQAGQLGCYDHDGRWQCMDTPREYDLLNRLWEKGEAFWVPK